MRAIGFMLVIVAALWSSVVNGPWVTLYKLSPLAQEMDGFFTVDEDKQEDSLRLGSYLRAIARLLREDSGRRQRIMGVADAKDLMFRVGNVTIGDEWSLPDKYPQLTKRLASELEGVSEEMLPAKLETLGDAMIEVGKGTW